MWLLLLFCNPWFKKCVYGQCKAVFKPHVALWWKQWFILSENLGCTAVFFSADGDEKLQRTACRVSDANHPLQPSDNANFVEQTQNEKKKQPTNNKSPLLSKHLNMFSPAIICEKCGQTQLLSAQPGNISHFPAHC